MTIPPPDFIGSPSDWRKPEQAQPVERGIFALEVDGTVAHLSTTGNLRRRIARVFRTLEPDARPIRALGWVSHSKLQSALILYRLAREFFPHEYLKRTHLRMPWFVGLQTSDPFPRFVLGNRIGTGWDPAVGPFSHRDSAQLFLQTLESSFLLRKCVETLHPSEDHPGCIYGEIRQCLRPCQRAVENERYLNESAQASAFLREGGRRMLTQLRDERQTAAETMDFERAAEMHRRIEKLTEAQAARGAIVADVWSFNGVAVEFVSESGNLQLFPFRQGLWGEMLTTSAAGVSGLETALQETLPVRFQQMEAAGDRLEHLAIFARWYYSSWRQGLWFPFEDVRTLPCRRIARGVQKLLR